MSVRPSHSLRHHLGEHTAGRTHRLDAFSALMERFLWTQRDAESDDFVVQLNIPRHPVERVGILSSLFNLMVLSRFDFPWLLLGRNLS